MNRYEQRRQKRLQNPAIAAGYREMSAEIQLMHALDEIRKRENMTKEDLAAQMGTRREVVSRLLNGTEVNPTLDTFIEMLDALKFTADIRLRPSKEGEEPLRIITEDTPV
jgi:transcriptional regulator with XRE-family HTH domain